MLCLSCGAVLKKKPYRKDRRFCSSKCRIKWWRKQVYMSDEEFVGQFKSKEAK
jgi:predicted nucleic acid-binding Zn ribbon protein